MNLHILFLLTSLILPHAQYVIRQFYVFEDFLITFHGFENYIFYFLGDCFVFFGLALVFDNGISDAFGQLPSLRSVRK